MKPPKTEGQSDSLSPRLELQGDGDCPRRADEALGLRKPAIWQRRSESCPFIASRMLLPFDIDDDMLVFLRVSLALDGSIPPSLPPNTMSVTLDESECRGVELRNSRAEKERCRERGAGDIVAPSPMKRDILPQLLNLCHRTGAGLGLNQEISWKAP